MLMREQHNTKQPTGACKILFTLPLIYFIIAKYAVASALTVITKGERRQEGAL